MSRSVYRTIEDAARDKDWKGVNKAMLALVGSGARPAPEPVLSALAEAAAHEEIVALNLAVCLFNGDAMAQDVPRARLMAEKLAASAEASVAGQAHSLLGDVMLHEDWDVDPDPARAILHFEKAASLDSQEGAFNAALLHHLGTRIPADAVKAEKFYRQVLEIDPDDVEAARNFGSLLIVAYGKHRFEEALAVLRHAESCGDEAIALFLREIGGRGHENWLLAYNALSPGHDLEDEDSPKPPGFESDDLDEMMDAMRASAPIAVAPWFEVLERIMGWELVAKTRSVSVDGRCAHIADVPGDGLKWPVFVTKTALYLEDDVDDVSAMKRIRDSILAKRDDAVLLASHVHVLVDKDRSGGDGMLAGYLLRDGAWKPFFYARGGFARTLADAGSDFGAERDLFFNASDIAGHLKYGNGDIDELTEGMFPPGPAVRRAKRKARARRLEPARAKKKPASGSLS